MQINHLAALVKVVAIGLAQNHTSPSRQNTPGVLRQFIDHVLLKITESVLTLAFKKLADRTTYAPLYDKVRIKKTSIQPPGQLPPYR